MKLLTWNVNGLRAIEKKGFLEWMHQESPDILCIQETKACSDQLGFHLTYPEGYFAHYSSCSVKKGYSGVATFSKQKPLRVTEGMGIEKFDQEGRMVTTEFEQFTLLNVYFPNGKASDERLVYKMEFYEAFLRHIQVLTKQGKKVIFCGDVNTAHRPVDLARPKENEKISGFLPIEREWMDRLVEAGYVDSLREFSSNPGLYTWWSLRSGARQRNVGWRIDYFFLEKSLRPYLRKAFILPEVMGSDHCPAGILLDF